MRSSAQCIYVVITNAVIIRCEYIRPLPDPCMQSLAHRIHAVITSFMEWCSQHQMSILFIKWESAPRKDAAQILTGFWMSVMQWAYLWRRPATLAGFLMSVVSHVKARAQCLPLKLPHADINPHWACWVAGAVLQGGFRWGQVISKSKTMSQCRSNVADVWPALRHRFPAEPRRKGVCPALVHRFQSCGWGGFARIETSLSSTTNDVAEGEVLSEPSVTLLCTYFDIGMDDTRSALSDALIWPPPQLLLVTLTSSTRTAIRFSNKSHCVLHRTHHYLSREYWAKWMFLQM